MWRIVNVFAIFIQFKKKKTYLENEEMNKPKLFQSNGIRLRLRLYSNVLKLIELKTWNEKLLITWISITIATNGHWTLNNDQFSKMINDPYHVSNDNE